MEENVEKISEERVGGRKKKKKRKGRFKTLAL